MQEELELGATFGSGFLDQHAGRIISDLHFAVVELVANAWDAGADQVRITWPSEAGEQVAFADNGAGMTREEFLHRWRELTYNRADSQGTMADTPPHRRGRKRVAFGRNGVGRHAMFHFADSYEVRTAKAGAEHAFRVTRAAGKAPFKVEVLESAPVDHTGTVLSATSSKTLLPEEEIAEMIGSRFVADPEFRIFVNENEVRFTDLEHLFEVGQVEVAGIGAFPVRRLDAQLTGRTSKQSGVAWWVHGRLVGTPSWDVFDGPLMDGRSRTGRRFVYIVDADPLGTLKRVKKDWSGFYASPDVLAVRRAVSDYIRSDLQNVTSDIRRDRKVSALRASKPQLERLPPTSREHIARFAEEIQLKSPSIARRDLVHAVQLLANLEEARSGYRLLARLAHLPPDDLDALELILRDWSVQDARRVLDELHFRLRLIEELETLVERHTTDELHDLQPLFERGLWIFGPRFEAISFTSNRTLATVVRELFGDAALSKPSLRPDFVVLPDTSIGIYSTDAFDSNNEVSGVESVVVVELKRGGHEVTNEDKDQAMRYTRELRKAGRVDRTAKITAYVLGTTIEPLATEVAEEGETEIIPRRYSDVLKQAHARTFNLLKSIEGLRGVTMDDRDLQDAMMDSAPEFDLSDDSELDAPDLSA